MRLKRLLILILYFIMTLIKRLLIACINNNIEWYRFFRLSNNNHEAVIMAKDGLIEGVYDSLLSDRIDTTKGGAF